MERHTERVPTYMDEGIILRRVNYGEADRILTVLTRGHGKLGVIARGVRKAGSRNAAATDLFVRSRMQLARGRGELDVLVQTERIENPPPFGDSRRAACASLCAELADRVLERHHEDSDTFDLVAGAFRGCADVARDPRQAVIWFARRMMDRLGYAPELHVCVDCGVGLAEEPLRFSGGGGGLLCRRCAAVDPSGIECSVRVTKVLRIAAAGDAELFWRLRLDEAALDTMEDVVEQELAHHLDRRLRSFDVLRAMDPSRGVDLG